MTQAVSGNNIQTALTNLVYHEAQTLGDDKRVPFRFWSTFSPTIVEMSINPQSVAFEHNKRITSEPLIKGRAIYFWGDDNGDNRDLMKLSFDVMTGNIGNGIPGTDARRLAWAKIYKLTAEPKVNNRTGERNRSFILFSTVLLDTLVLFEGYYPNVAKITEKADAPHNKTYSFEFICERVTPDIGKLADLLGVKFVAESLIGSNTRIVTTGF